MARSLLCTGRMKKNPKKLSFSKQTLRTLDANLMRGVAGGLAGATFTDTGVAGGCFVTAGTCWWSDCQGCV